MNLYPAVLLVRCFDVSGILGLLLSERYKRHVPEPYPLLTQVRPDRPRPLFGQDFVVFVRSAAIRMTLENDECIHVGLDLLRDVIQEGPRIIPNLGLIEVKEHRRIERYRLHCLRRLGVLPRTPHQSPQQSECTHRS